MSVITLDWETYYDKECSLKKMSEVDYILDPRFHVIMCAIKEGDAPVRVLTTEQEIRAAIESIDWDNHSLLSHNTRFDGAILAWHYGKTPGLYLDTLSMARAITHPKLGSSSLAKLAEHFGLSAKGDAVIRNMGRTRADFSDSELAEYAEYCAHDTDLCRAIFDKLIKVFPQSELRLIDLALRMFIEPQAQLDANKLAAHLAQVRADKEAAFARIAHIPPETFSSNARFAELLQSYGVEVPRKISPTTGSETWALARGDRAFKDLCSDPDQPVEVQAALACRISAKSTIDETRCATMLGLAQRDWGRLGERWMPVPYRYYGAHTGRFSGDGGYNFANLRRGSPIRDSITAPAGHRIVHRDSSQIEARLVAWLARCNRLVEAFRQGRDVYSEFASVFYQRPITKADTKERFAGKTAILSLGYGAGAEKFRHTLYIGTGGVSLSLTDTEADELVRLYRDEYPQIPRLWRAGKDAINRMISPPERFEAPPIPVIELGKRRLWLPNGMLIQYPGLRREIDPDSTSPIEVYDGPYKTTKKIYGAKLIENITQALARIVVTDVLLRVHRETGFHPFMSTYDSHDYVVPEELAREFDTLLEGEFGKAPAWAAGLPLASEGGWGRTLLEAERGANR